jgi:hypothetical protein
MLLQLRETLNDHRDISLLEILKEKQCIETKIGDFDIECVLDEETHVNWHITLPQPGLLTSWSKDILYH